MLTTKRAYEPASADDGKRILIDRLWPRGISKERAKIDTWMKDIAPSTELRKWYGHDPAKWAEFERRYKAELARPEKKQLVDELARLSKEGKVTLVYAARDTEHSDANVLAELVAKAEKK